MFINVLVVNRLPHLELKFFFFKLIHKTHLFIIFALLGKLSLQPQCVNLGDCMSKYRQQLQDKYKFLQLTSPDELLECRPSEYVNLKLTLVDKRTKTSREELVSGLLSSVFRKQSSQEATLTLAGVLNVKDEEKKLILIEGGPGMGKSTLAIKMCKCWADGELLEEYDAVILLPLRDPEIQAAKSIKDFLLILDEELRDQVYKEISKRNGDNICFILEGYDELPDDLRRAPNFAKLMDKLPKCTIMYTSRPEACDKLRQLATRRIEIDGFKEEQVYDYISSAFENEENGKEKASKLTSHVRSNPSIRSILYVPINVAIVCHLFLLNLSLPNTLTQLYTLLCLNLILRHITKYGNVKVDYLKSFYRLPTPYMEQFSKLCQVAYRNSQNDKIVFSGDELSHYGIDVSKMSGLGLLHIAPSTSVYGREKSYNFLHLTVQEFCAAFYISVLPPQEQCHIYQFNDRFRMIWKFYAGITALNNKEIFHCMLPSKWVKSKYKKRRIVELLHCLYEAQNDELIQLLGDHLDGNIDLSFCRLDQISCSALGYLLEQYRGVLKLVDVGYCDISDEGCRIILTALMSCNVNSSQLHLRMGGNDITNDCSSLIASLLLSKYPIIKLDIDSNELSDHINIFHSLQHNTVLTELSLQSPSLILLDMKSLGEMLSINKTLTVLDISSNDIGPDGCQYLADCRNISLSKLIMSGCKLSVSGADKIGETICYNKAISSVDLGNNNIGDSGVQKLVGQLRGNTTLKHLDLWKNGITVIGAKHLKGLLTTHCSSLNNIELSRNPLGDNGVDIILQSLTITMEHVGLYDTGMTSCCLSLPKALHNVKSISFTPSSVCDTISDGLANTVMLEHVELYDGSDAAYHTLISGISRNSSINKLMFSGGDLHHQTVLSLVQVLKVNKTITTLTIWDVNISPSDYVLLAELCAVNETVRELRIWPSDEKRLDQSTVLQIVKQIQQNYTLELLVLWITDEAEDDDQFIRDVEILTKQYNNNRQSHGVTTPLQVELIWYNILNITILLYCVYR